MKVSLLNRIPILNLRCMAARPAVFSLRNVVRATFVICLLASISSIHAQTFTHAFGVPGMCPENKNGTGINLYLPYGAQHVRGVLIIPMNTNMMHVAKYTPMRSFVAEQELAILYLRCSILIGKDGGNDIDTAKLMQILDTLAKQTNIPDLRHAPWITFGLSSVGRVPFYLIWKTPERCIAGITWHGEVPTYPPTTWARITDEPMPYLCITGQSEWSGHWRLTIRPGLLYWRKRGWLTNMAVGAGVGHLTYSGAVKESMMLEYITNYVRAAVMARLPVGVYPTNGPIQLNRIDPESGYLISPRVDQLLANTTSRPDTMIRPYTDVPEAKRDSMFWTFNRQLAEDYIAFHTFWHTASAAQFTKSDQGISNALRIKSMVRNGHLTIQTEPSHSTRIRVYSLSGKALVPWTQIQSGGTASFDISKFAQGSVFIEAIRNDGERALVFKHF